MPARRSRFCVRGYDDWNRVDDTWISDRTAEFQVNHLISYGAAFYTYPWSQVISNDLETRFNGNLFDPKVAALYRRTILEGAHSAPAARLVEDFLGRLFSTAAWGKRVMSTDSGGSQQPQ